MKSLACLLVAAALSVLLVGRPAHAAGPPNIILVLTDDDDMYSLAHMPWLSSQSDWVRFTAAHLNSSLCCVSRTTILTGEYDTHTGVINNQSAKNFNPSATLATWLHGAGYRTGLIGKYLNCYPCKVSTDYTTPVGWDDWHAFYRTPKYYNYSLVENGALVPYGSAEADYATDVLTQKALAFIDSTSAGTPFFLYLTPFSPHLPTMPPRRYIKAVTGPAPHFPNFNTPPVNGPAWVTAIAPLTATQIKTEDTERLHLWETMMAVDDMVKAITADLTASGQIDNTVILYMTDNGISIGSHRWLSKRCEYNECDETQLLVHAPGAVAGTRDQLISNIDIASTVLDFAGVTPTLPQDGMSFRPLLTGAPWRDAILLHWSGGDAGGDDSDRAIPAWYAIRTAGCKYVEIETGETELYDEAADPYELINIVGTPDAACDPVALAAQLATLKAASLAKITR